MQYITKELPGVGGAIKSEPRYFQVQEIPIYEPQGTGNHLFVRLTREGMTTRDVIRKLAAVFGIKEEDIGCAGQKDKQALVTQTFSLFLPEARAEQVAQRIERETKLKVHWAKPHSRKLRTGHLLGNSFTIILTDPAEEAESKALAVQEALRQRGLPNFYGQQRFGLNRENIEKGRETLMGRGPKKSWLKRFLLNSYQSHLFNHYLSERINLGWFQKIKNGDIAKKSTTGGLFLVDDYSAEQPRLDAGEITYTGPIYGSKLRWAQGEPGELEKSILDRFEVSEEMLSRSRLKGTRRPARLILDNLAVEPHDLGLLFQFSLPKGAYATVVLREFTKSDDFMFGDHFNH